ncbi:MAG: hypothetical protein AAFP79_10645 [Pseudomonadota bacterium]
MTTRFLFASLSAVFLAGCSTVQGALDYGRGPFDQSPASTSEAALKGLHESSWGNSGKWGAKVPAEEGNVDPSKEDPPTGG